jgi:hypothetical protein
MVQREGSTNYSSSADRVIEALNVVLSEKRRGYSYVNVVPNYASSEISVQIKPRWWPLMLTTPMTVTWKPEGSGTQVTARTTSQAYITADVANFYRGYIQDLFEALNRRLRDGAAIKWS